MAASQKDMGGSEKLCPVCGELGSGQSSLMLRQINAEEAIYVCENPACCYPVGYDVKSVKRPIPTLLGDKQETANTSGKKTGTINGNSTIRSMQRSALVVR